MGDDAVRARTGRGWEEWFALLDAAGGAGMGHRERVAVVGREGVPAWWQQMVVVGYEQRRGIREPHQTPRGYQGSVSLTIQVPVERLFAAWSDDSARAGWLQTPVTVRRATPGRSLRLTWEPDGTGTDVNLYAVGETRSRVSVQHTGLASLAQVGQAKAAWKDALQRLKRVLEG